MTKKILIADDDEGIIDLLACGLEAAGFAVVSCTTGSKIMDLVHREHPALIVLDVMLPGLDGYTLQIQLDQDETTRGIPVVIITALPAAKVLFDRFSQVKAFVGKPFDAADLVKKITKLCGGV